MQTKSTSSNGKLRQKENMQTLCVCEQKDKNSNRNTVTVEMWRLKNDNFSTFSDISNSRYPSTMPCPGTIGASRRAHGTSCTSPVSQLQGPPAPLWAPLDRAAVGHGAPGIACTAAATSSSRATGQGHPLDAAAGPPSRPRRWPWGFSSRRASVGLPSSKRHSALAASRAVLASAPQRGPPNKTTTQHGSGGKGGVEKTGVELLGANKCLDLLKKPDPFYDGFNPWNLRSAVWQLWMCSLKSGSKASQLEPSNSMAAVLCSLEASNSGTALVAVFWPELQVKKYFFFLLPGHGQLGQLVTLMFQSCLHVLYFRVGVRFFIQNLPGVSLRTTSPQNAQLWGQYEQKREANNDENFLFSWGKHFPQPWEFWVCGPSLKKSCHVNLSPKCLGRTKMPREDLRLNQHWDIPSSRGR